MWGTRGRAGVVVVIFLALVGGLVTASASDATGCVLLCAPGVTTTTPASVTAAPVVSSVAITAHRGESATFSGTVDPQGLATEWRFEVGPVGDEGAGPTTYERALPAGTSPDPVSATITELEPGVKYQVDLFAQNAVGMTSGPELTFNQPLLPRLSIRLRAKGRTAVLEYTPIKFSAALGGIAPYATLGLQAEPVGTHRYYRLASTTLGTATRHVTLRGEPDENSRVRVVLKGGMRPRSTSNVVTVTVFPKPVLSLEQDPSDSADIDVDFYYVIHYVPFSFVGEPVYFYRGASRSGPFTRFAVVRLRRAHNTYYGPVLVADTRSPASAGVVIAECVRHQVVPDMGVPFTDRACGGPVLH